MPTSDTTPKVHPLIHLADTMPLDGYATGTAHDVLMREADGMWCPSDSWRHQCTIISAMQLAEYILSKRVAAYETANLFPIPPSTKAPVTVKAKQPRIGAK